MEPFSQVTTPDGRVGVVKSVVGRHVTVVVPGGAQEVYDVADVQATSAGPADDIRNGRFAPPEAFAHRLRSLYLQHAYRYDLRSGLSNARIEPKLHQVFIAHRVTNKLQPRMVLADEVGLGKTIEAGLILKELRARGQIERALIVCPSNLAPQWQTELRTKFNEDFEIINSSAAKYFGQGGANPFLRRSNLIASYNFAQSEKRAAQIVEAPWDLVIFDEAHRVRRSRQGGSKVQSTLAYQLADELKEIVNGLLLLTATPMQLDPFELYSLVELVEPGMFKTFQHYERRRQDLPRLNRLIKALNEWEAMTDADRTSVTEQSADLLEDANVRSDDLRLDVNLGPIVERIAGIHPLADTLVRNRKSEIGGFAGRVAKSVPVELSSEERQLFHEIADYLRYEYGQAVESKQLAIGFLMVTYQKMLASSPAAVLASFKKRVEKLRRGPKGSARPAESLDEVAEVLEDSSQLDAYVAFEEGNTSPLVAAEIARLEQLIARLEDLPHDSKAEQLLSALDVIWSEDPAEKVVLFTAFKDTQDYLSGLIRQHLRVAGSPVRVACFNGSMSIDQKEDAIRSFREKDHILISTEAGGEGRNLQFAHILINYDLPWNPMKVEQRIGRLDRIGQRRQVFIYNLACKGTVEQRVLEVLNDRIRLFEESVGSLDPILGGLEDQLAKLVMADASKFGVAFEELATDVERRTAQARKNEQLLADLALDRSSFRRDEANRLLGHRPMATANDLRLACRELLEFQGGTLMEHAEGGEVITLSPQLATRLKMKSHQLRGTFDPVAALVREDIDFFALGHPLVDSLLAVGASDSSAQTTCHVVPGYSGPPCLEVVYEVESNTVPPQGDLVSIRVTEDGSVGVSKVEGLPVGGQPAVELEVSWSPHALEQAEARFRDLLTERRAELLEAHHQQKRDQRERAVRIFEYRQLRLTSLIEQQQQWIATARASESSKTAKILPAREGKLRKDRERLRDLEAEHREDLERIEAEQLSVRGRMLAVSVVVAQ